MSAQLTSQRGRSARGSLMCLTLAVSFIAACASLPPGRYAIDEVRIEGTEQMDPQAIETCLATRERDRIVLQLGLSASPVCGSPPFDANPPRLRLWRWSWTEWPLYDEFIFERDLERVERWYHARGFYDARVVDWIIDPPSAMESDEIDETTYCQRLRRLGDEERIREGGAGCLAEVTIWVEEGQPILIEEIEVLGLEDFEPELRERLRSAVSLAVGGRFDEADYEAAKAALRSELVETSYALAEVTGAVAIDRTNYAAGIVLIVEPGPSCEFGRVIVEGAEDLPIRAIIDAAQLDAAQPYSNSAVLDAQSAIYDLGAFSSVNVRTTESAPGSHVLDVVIEVQPAQRTRFAIGGGVQSGIIEQGAGETRDEVPQWDIHLLASWEHRNLFGGMRRLRLEDRPRMIFPDTFPGIESPRPGNQVSLRFWQPAFIEARTTLVLGSTWDWGPDPYLVIPRHEVDASLGIERFFWRHQIFLRIGLREQFYIVPGTPEPEVPGTTVPGDFDLMNLEQLLTIDLRDDPARTELGVYASLSMQEAGFFMPSSWSYVRAVSDVRFFLPLFAHIVIAGRISLSAIMMSEANEGLDDLSRQLGPTTERLRGGGGSSNRGFSPGELGDGPDGGTRRWLASLEIRFPVLRSLYLTAFADMGDVSREERFRFDHPQTSVGVGLRLLTLIGTIRIDFGWRVSDWQFLDTDERDPGGTRSDIDLLLFDFPGAVNLTLGEAF